MSCPFEEEVLLLSDGGLPFARRAIVEAHLAVCDSCARIEETLDRVDQALSNGEETPLGVVDRALATLPSRQAVRWAPLTVAAALAAAILLALLLFPLDSSKPSGTPEPRGPIVSAPGETPEPRTPTVSAPGERPAPAPQPLPPPTASGRTPLRELVADLDPESETFRAGAERVASSVAERGAAGTSALAKLLRSQDRTTVKRALAVARHVPTPRIIGALERLLEDEEFARPAARLLGTVGGSGSVPALKRVLAGPASVEAREALVAIGDAAALRVLEERARRFQSAEWLDALVRASPKRGANALLELLRHDGESHAIVRVTLDRRGDELRPWLRKGLGIEETAREASIALGWMHDVGSADRLAVLAQESRSALAATQALLELGTDEAMRGAFAAVHQGRAPDAAADCFEGAGRAESYLLHVLRTGDRRERRTALELLARCGGEDTIAYLESARLDHRLEPLVVRALGATGDERALAALRRAAQKRKLSREVALALGNIESPESAELLVDLLENPKAQRAAIESLQNMPARIVVPVLLRRLEEARRAMNVRHVLASIAGSDLGAKTENWKRWWDSRAS